MWTRHLPAFVAIALAGCVSARPVHHRALENNELCAQDLSKDDLVAAEVHCDLGLQFSPEYADLWVNKGLIALKRGNVDEAKGHFIKALRYNQEQAQAYNNLGYVYLKERSYGKARDNFQRALKVNPDYREARYNLGLCFMDLGEKEKARKEFRTLIAVAPELADPHHELGLLAIEDQHYDDAVAELSEAVRLDPSFTDAWLNLGIAWGELGKLTEALDAEKRCIELDAKLPACHFGLFQIFSAQHDDQNARTACQSFLRFARADDFPDQVQACEKYLSANDD